MPEEKRERLKREYGIGDNFAKVLILDKVMADYFEEVAKEIDPKLSASWIVDVLRGELNYRGKDFRFAYKVFKPKEFAKLLSYLKKGLITEKGAVEVIRTKLEHGGEVDGIIRSKGLFAISREEVEKICREVVESCKKAVEDYKSGKKQALDYLVGQVMKRTRGKADPAETAKIIRSLIEG